MNDWTGNPPPPPNARISALETSNAVLRKELFGDRKRAQRAFWYGMTIGAVLAFGAGMAFGETISIGSLYTHGEESRATTVTITPSDVPGQLAIVTMDNRYVNQGSDNGDYSLTLDGMTVGVTFLWDASPVLGSDRITLTPPAGITCLPVNCTVTVPEGLTGQIILLDYLGF